MNDWAGSTLCQNAEAVEGPSLEPPARYPKEHPTRLGAAFWRAGILRAEKIVLQFRNAPAFLHTLGRKPNDRLALPWKIDFRVAG